MPIVEGSGPKWVKYDCQRMPQDGKPTGGNRLHTDEALIPWWGKSAVNESFQKSVVAHCPVDDCETNTTRSWYWYYHSTSPW